MSLTQVMYLSVIVFVRVASNPLTILVPIWMWTENVERAWCYHPACLGVQDTDYYGDEDDLDWDDWMREAAIEDEGEEESEDEYQLDLGTCARKQGKEVASRMQSCARLWW